MREQIQNKLLDPSARKAELAAFIETVKANTMVGRIGLESLYDQVVFCETASIVGDFVECGVWKAGAVGMMALTNLAHGKDRRHLHLFDSFEEICEPDAEIDGQRAIDETTAWSSDGQVKGRLVPLKGCYDNRGGPGSIAEAQELIINKIGYDQKYLHCHKGWFQNTLPVEHQQISKIAILRIDADWYASTKVCLDYLFDKVVPGGFVIIDDYGAYEGCQKAVDEFLGKFDKPYYLHPVNSYIRYLVRHYE